MSIKTSTSRLCAALFALLFFTAAGATTDKGKGRISLTFTDEPLPSALKKIERQGGKSILFTYGETERYRVTAAIRDKTQAEALAAVLKDKPFSYIERDIYFVVQHTPDKAARAGVTGRVTDPQGRPLAFATVVMLTKAGGRYVTGGVTADDGTFVLPSMPAEPCLLKVSFVGCKTAVAECRRDNSIRLEADSRQLKEVVVRNDRPMIERKGGNILANVAGTPLSQMGSASDMISHLPFVNGDGGSFSVIGRGSAEVYINGRKVRDAEELNQLQATEILQAELIMNPGARYSAEVGAVIRLKTIRLRGQGFSGSGYTDWSQGRRGNGREGFSLNYRRGGLDVFVKENLKYAEGYSTKQDLSIMNTSAEWRMLNDLTITGRSASFKGEAGFNYEPDQRQSLGMRYVAATALGRDWSRTCGTTVITRDGEPYDRLATDSYDESKNGWNHSLNAYYTGTFGQWGVDFNADYVGGDSRSWQTAANDGTTDAESYNDVDNRLYAAKLVITAPLFGGTLGVGTEESFTDRRDRFVQSGFSADADDHLRQHYYSAFADYAVTLGRFHLSAGLRYEHRRTRYEEAGVFMAGQSPTYRDLLPSASVTYSHGGVNLSLAYRQMVLSPSYRMLSSKTSYVSKYMYDNGDPLLVPQKHNSVTLDGGWRWVNFSLWYDYTLHMYTSYFMPYDDAGHPGVMLKTMASIPYTHQYGGQVELTPKFGVWQPRLYAGVNWYDSDATSLGIPYLANEPQFWVGLDNSFTFPNGWFVNLRASYDTRATMSYAVSQPEGQVKLRVAKSFFKDKSLKIGLNVDDIFRTGRDRFTLYGDRTYYDGRRYNDRQRVRLTVNYTFNATKSKYRGKGAGQAEKQRL